jgi:MOSC domain-containing protein YiiM
MDGEMMRIVSVNVGMPQEVVGRDSMVRTGIYKSPIAGRVMLRRLNLDGDGQADLSVHGGAYKAVYFYPHEHYAYWRQEFGGRVLPMGVFGENFTIEGIREDSIHLGDRLAFGEAEVAVTQPRLPCHKLAMRFQDDEMIKRFQASGRSGFYAMVTREGEVGAGDEIRVVARDPNAVRISDAVRLHAAKSYDSSEVEVARRALLVDALPNGWKARFRERLEQ